MRPATATPPFASAFPGIESKFTWIVRIARSKVWGRTVTVSPEAWASVGSVMTETLFPVVSIVSTTNVSAEAPVPTRT